MAAIPNLVPQLQLVEAKAEIIITTKQTADQAVVVENNRLYNLEQSGKAMQGELLMIQAEFMGLAAAGVLAVLAEMELRQQAELVGPGQLVR
jgi:hypothetical protein